MILAFTSCESGSIFDEKPVAVSATDRLEVLASDLKPTCDTAGVLVRAGKEPVTFTLRAEEPIGGGKVILGGEKAFALKAGEERSCFLPLETSDVTTRLTVFVNGRAIWRKAFAAAWDCASHEKLAVLKPGRNRIKVALDADHQAKLVYVGTRFEERHVSR